MTKKIIASDKLIVRQWQETDFDATRKLFYETVHAINAKDYTPEQLNAWAPAATVSNETDREKIRYRFEQNQSHVVEYNDIIVGFGDLTPSGEVDHLHVHKDFQSQGIGSLLLRTMEDQARALGLKELTTEASITAKPFFEKHGFIVEKSQIVERRGQQFKNFVMSKKL